MDTPDPSAMPERGARFWIGTLASLFLGGVFLVAAWAKVIDPAAFVELIALEGLHGPLPAWLVASIGLAVEAGIGLALVLNVRRLWVLLPATGLCLFFVYLTGRAYLAHVQGEGDPARSCGCFGNLVERTPAAAFWGDLLLLVPALVLSFFGRRVGAAWPRVRLELIGAVILIVLAFAWKAPDLPLDDMATRLGPGTRVDELCIGRDEQRTCIDQLAPEFGEGRHLMMLADLGQREFRYAVSRLNELVASESGIGLVVLTAAEPAEITNFKWELGPTFDIRHAPAALLRPLYRRTPRAALIQDGLVIRTYDGLPPAEELAQPGGPGVPEKD